MIWKKRQVPEQIEWVNESKKIKVYAYEIKDNYCGDIEQIEITMILKNDPDIFSRKYLCIQLVYKIADGFLRKNDNDEIKKIYYNGKIEKPKCLLFAGIAYMVCSNLELLKKQRKIHIEEKLENLTHEKAITRLREQLQEINEEGADK